MGDLSYSESLNGIAVKRKNLSINAWSDFLAKQLKSALEMLPTERIKKVTQQWFLAEPLLFGAWTTHKTIANPYIASIRIGHGQIEYNPEFIGTLDKQTLHEVMKCEALRIVLKHPYERRKPHREYALDASNMSISQCMPTTLPLTSPQTRFGTDAHNGKYFEYYYNLLIGSKPVQQPIQKSATSDAKRQGQQANDNHADKTNSKRPSDSERDLVEVKIGSKTGCCKKCGNKPGQCQCSDGTSASPGSSGSNSQGLGVASDTSNSGGGAATVEQYCDPSVVGFQNTIHWDYDQFLCEQMNDLITDIESSNCWGTVAGNGREMILATRRPRLDYRSVLRSFRANVLSTKRRLTRMKPSRRYDFLYMGSRRDFTTRLLFAVDVSGSVISQDVRNAFSIVNRLFKYGVESIDVIWFDTAIRNKEPLTIKRARQTVTVDGRGGTNFQPLMDYLDEHRQYDGLIVFTDGIAPVPERPKENHKTRVVWLFNHEKNWQQLHLGLDLPGMTSAFVLAD